MSIQCIDVHIILESSIVYSRSLDTLKAELKGWCFVSGFEPTQAIMEPSAILLASPPRDSAFQVVSGLLDPSRPMGPTGPPGSEKAIHDTGVASTSILEVGPDTDGGWVNGGEEGPRASKSHRLICE
jgi:hypothetical protein